MLRGQNWTKACPTTLKPEAFLTLRSPKNLQWRHAGQTKRADECRVNVKGRLIIIEHLISSPTEVGCGSLK